MNVLYGLGGHLGKHRRNIQTACRRSFSGFYMSYVASCKKLCFCPHLHIINACFIDLYYMHFYGKGLILLSEVAQKRYSHISWDWLLNLVLFHLIISIWYNLFGACIEILYFWFSVIILWRLKSKPFPMEMAWNWVHMFKRLYLKD